MHRLKRSLLCLLVVLLGYAGVSAYFAWQLTSPLRRSVGEIPPELPASTQSVDFPARDGVSLSGWFVPCAHATRGVVLLHGHGQTRRQMIARARLFHDAGYAALLYDARSHGLSEGNKVSAGRLETADLLGALDFLRAKTFVSSVFSAPRRAAPRFCSRPRNCRPKYAGRSSRAPTPRSATPSTGAFVWMFIFPAGWPVRC